MPVPCPPPPRRSAARARRRGAVLPFVCILLTVLIGALALAVDLNRTSVIAAEAQADADAAAHAAAVALQRATPAGTDAAATPAAAVDVGGRNRAAGSAVTILGSDVEPTVYDPAAPDTARAAAYGGRVNGVAVNSVRVTARVRGVYAFAQALGLAPPTVKRKSTAWIANLGLAVCVRPSALPYTGIYETLNGVSGYSSAGQVAPNFTQAQVAALAPWTGRTARSRTVVVLPPWASPGTYTANGYVNSGTWAGVPFSSSGQSNQLLVFGSLAVSTLYFSPGSYAYNPNCSSVSLAGVGGTLPAWSATNAQLAYYANDSTEIKSAHKLGDGYPGLCNRAALGTAAGDATCRTAAGAAGVETRFALADAATGGALPVRMVTHARVMCYFVTPGDTCGPTTVTDVVGTSGRSLAWAMPGPSTGYPAGTMVVLFDAPYPMRFDYDTRLKLSDSVGFTQRVVLVK